MNPLISKIKPANGFSYLLHLGLVMLMPALVLILVRLDFVPLALSVILLSKWRMFAVRPRFWPVNIRANAIDIIVGLSTVLFISHTASGFWQLLWAALYGIWLTLIKPTSGVIMVSVQAFLGQMIGLMALYLVWRDGPLYGLVLLSGLLGYLAARHFFDSFEEPYGKLLSYSWGYFAAALTWLLGHWLLFYGLVAQPTLLLSTIGYGLATIYYLDHNERLSSGLRRQFIFIMIAIVLVVLTFSDWGDKVF
ncbi:MAG TPA: hypothetical protein VLG37_00880 [Candidatus Saccharimonadales bacterium]|nr:hypothetical protein [Candidatus Saccharimonadales bacterium]